MARTKGRLIDLIAPSSTRKGPSKVTNRLFPKFTVANKRHILAGLVAKILHVVKHH